MKLPIWPKGERQIIDEDGIHVCFTNTMGDRDYIIKVINSNERLVETIKAAIRIKDLWYFQSREPQYEDESEALETMRSMFEQALKEAEKS